MAIFTLAEARALLPRVQDITQQYHDLVAQLQEQLEELHHPRQVRQMETRIHNELQQWVQAIQALGVDVKGLWLADFDSGDGYYYCWQLGEDDIAHFHRYETGFAGRRPIAFLDI